jgi:hypothetical protein
MTGLPIAPIVASALQAVFEDESVSEIFRARTSRSSGRVAGVVADELRDQEGEHPDPQDAGGSA